MTKKKYSIIVWDWREEVPLSEIIDVSKFYKHYFSHEIDDTRYIIFSDSTISNEEEAEEILAMDDEELASL